MDTGANDIEKPTSSSSTVDATLDLTDRLAALTFRSKLDNSKDTALVPGWENDFWHRYGNKLRVYGTVEEMCDLTAIREPPVPVQNEMTDDAEGGGVEISDAPRRKSSIWDEIGSTIRSFI